MRSLFNVKIKEPFSWAKNPQDHAMSKDIDIQWHYYREDVESGTVDLQYMPTEEQIANSIAKALPKNQSLILRNALGLE